MQDWAVLVFSPDGSSFVVNDDDSSVHVLSSVFFSCIIRYEYIIHP